MRFEMKLTIIETRTSTRTISVDAGSREHAIAIAAQMKSQGEEEFEQYYDDKGALQISPQGHAFNTQHNRAQWAIGEHEITETWCDGDLL